MNDKKDLDNQYKELRMLSKPELIQKKYEYIMQSKMERDKQEYFKNISTIITIIITLVTTILGIFVSLSNSSLQLTEKYITTQSDVTKIIETLNNTAIDIGQMYGKILVVIFICFVICVYIVIKILSKSKKHGDKASEYETLVKYIEDELLH